jgi:hypothetical protein
MDFVQEFELRPGFAVPAAGFTLFARMCCYQVSQSWLSFRNYVSLKVLTNEKRGGLKVVVFDRSPFKLFTLRFSNKSVQAPSSERPKTTQRTLFLSFVINNCLQITAWCRAATRFSHHTLNSNNAIVHPPRYLRRR